VLIEHNMEIVRSLADTVYVLDGGKVIAEGSPANVLAEPAVVDAYLGK
jgi:ABC-type branched-subunit amino acid transport system ATPase component